MNTMLEKMRKFHEAHSQDEILAIWKSLDQYSNVGILATDYIEYVKSSHDSVLMADVICNPEKIKIKPIKNVENPKFTSDSLFIFAS